MKTFFKSSEIPHRWAMGAGYGRSPSALSFQRPILRSYATDIGRILEQDRAVLLNLSRYSNSTNRHQSAMRAAVRHYPLQFEVRGLDCGEVLRRLNPAEIVDNITAQAVESYAKAQRARSYRDLHEADARHYARMANEAAAYFKLRRKPVEFDALPEVARRMTAAQKAKETKRRKAAEKAEAERMARVTEWLEAWKRGESVPFGGHSGFYRLPVALRLVDDEGRLTVETSHGARVLLRQALRLFRYCQALKARGETYSAQGSQNHPVQSQRFQVGPYSLDSITRNGDAVVGCHSLPFAEMERLYLTLTPEQISEAQSERVEVSCV